MVFLFLRVAFWYTMFAVAFSEIWAGLGLPGNPYTAGAWIVHICVVILAVCFMYPLVITAREAVITKARLGPMKHEITQEMITAAKQNLINKKENV